MNYLSQLNPQQRLAVEAGDGPIIILAGPGTGKTKTLTARIAHLIKTGEAQPEQILALTFTKKAAQEMRERVETNLLGLGAPLITTFHGLCYQIINDFYHEQIEFIKEPQRQAIIKALPRPADLRHLSTRELALAISQAKNSLTKQKSAIQTVTTAYNAELRNQNLHDFDDLLLRTRQLLASDQSAQNIYKNKFAHILVDEFQDTNQLQYQLLNLWRGNENVFVIGDPKQSIYGFRGASGDIFEQFKADFAKHTAINLNINYRSAPEVVNLSNAIFKDQIPLSANKTTSGQVQAVQVLNQYSEANWVLNQIQQAIGGGDFLNAVSDAQASKTLRDFAVLYRSRSAAIGTQRVLADSGLPVQVVGEGSPYEQPQIQAIINLLKAKQTGETVQIKGFSKVQCQKLLQSLPKTETPLQLAQEIISTFGFEYNLQTKQFLSTIVRFKTLAAALEYIEDIAQQNFYDPAADAITLLTIHAAKGLEFTHVFLIGAEEDILPHKKADLSEERRLFYVAVTRAKQRLDILHTKIRGGKPAEPSCFITELGDKVLPKIIDPNLQTDQRRAQKRAVKQAQGRLF